MNGVSKPMVKVKPVHLGKNVRMSFNRINEVLEMPKMCIRDRIYSACGSESAWTAVLERQFPLK